MKTIIGSATKLRCKKFAWLRGKEWKWHIVFTHHISVLLPKKTFLYSYFNKQVLTAMGFDEFDNESNGPND